MYRGITMIGLLYCTALLVQLAVPAAISHTPINSTSSTPTNCTPINSTPTNSTQKIQEGLKLINQFFDTMIQIQKANVVNNSLITVYRKINQELIQDLNSSSTYVNTYPSKFLAEITKNYTLEYFTEKYSTHTELTETAIILNMYNLAENFTGKLNILEPLHVVNHCTWMCGKNIPDIIHEKSQNEFEVRCTAR